MDDISDDDPDYKKIYSTRKPIPDEFNELSTRLDSLIESARTVQNSKLITHESWDKQLMTTSTLALGFMFSFLNNFLPVNNSIYQSIFALSAFMFVLTIIIISFSYHISADIHDRVIEYINSDINYTREVKLREEVIRSKMDILEDRSTAIKELNLDAIEDKDNKIIIRFEAYREALYKLNKAHREYKETENPKVLKKYEIAISSHGKLKNLNNTKQYTFLTAITFLTFFVLVNFTLV